MNTLLESLKRDLIRALEMLAIIERVNNQRRIYDAAFAFLGRDASPEDRANDEYGCAESLSRVLQKALPNFSIPLYVSTRALGEYFLKSPSFQSVREPVAGDIIISVTGMGNGRVSNGHCGIVGKNKGPDGTLWIMSNDSRTGTWEANYTIGSWRRYYEERGGMPTQFFEAV